ALTEGVLKTMFLTRLKTVTAVLGGTAGCAGFVGGSVASTPESAAARYQAGHKVKTQGDRPHPLARIAAVCTALGNDKAAAKTDTATTSPEHLHGVWSVVSINNDGKPEKLENATLIVHGKRACWQNSHGEIQGGLYLNPASKPKTYDLAMSTTTIEGIYTLD